MVQDAVLNHVKKRKYAYFWTTLYNIQGVEKDSLNAVINKSHKPAVDSAV